ncbi:rRNA methyltransferase 1, mitochondrial [Sardina pilchardus]|uniref:rRNA methyltransferase 1, mitochondrial n=1 Tax=Sardina pilchardus TaxID=27697 RepID=UPI002E1564AB
MICNSLNMYTMFRLMSLRSVKPSVSSQTMRKGSQIAPYCSRTLAWSSNSESEQMSKLRRSAINSSGLRNRAKVSSKWKNDTAHSMDSGQSVVPHKLRSKVTSVLHEREKGAKQKISPELQTLMLEDLPAGERRTFRTPKEEEPSVKGKQGEVVFGLSPCLLALTQGRRKASTLFVKEGDDEQRDAVQKVCEEAIKRGVQIKWVHKRELDKMTQGRVHQGVCLQASRLQYLRGWITPQKDEHRNQVPLWLVLDGVQDPMNLGAIIRSAYFLGVDRIASSIQNSCPLTPVVSKASSGVMEVMDIYGYHDLEDMIKVKKEKKWQVIGTVGVEEKASEVKTVKCSDFQMQRPTLLLMGGEGSGLSPDLRALCDVLLTIPSHRELHPGVESLNVSVATGILLHSLLNPRSRDRQ